MIEALEFTAGLVNAQGGWGRHKAFKDSFDFFGAENEFAKDQLGAIPRWELVLAASVIATLPMVVLFFLGQRYFVEGIATTGRKG